MIKIQSYFINLRNVCYINIASKVKNEALFVITFVDGSSLEIPVTNMTEYTDIKHKLEIDELL